MNDARGSNGKCKETAEKRRNRRPFRPFFRRVILHVVQGERGSEQGACVLAPGSPPQTDSHRHSPCLSCLRGGISPAESDRRPSKAVHGPPATCWRRTNLLLDRHVRLHSVSPRNEVRWTTRPVNNVTIGGLSGSRTGLPSLTLSPPFQGRNHHLGGTPMTPWTS